MVIQLGLPIQNNQICLLCCTVLCKEFFVKKCKCLEAWRKKARNNHQRCSMKNVVLQSFAKFRGKHLCQNLLFNKVAGLRLWRRCFLVNLAKFLKTPVLQNTSWRPHLKTFTFRKTNVYFISSYKFEVNDIIHRSSRPKVFYKIRVLESFAKNSQENTCVRVSF